MVRTLDDDGLDAGDRKILGDIARVGWHVVLIPEEGGTPGWAFTVGLFHTYQHPEVVVFGLTLELAGQLLTVIGSAVKDGKKYEAGAEYPDVLERGRCTFRTVDRRWYGPFLGCANWFHRGRDYPALQCFWPDKQNHFPWDRSFKTTLRGRQPFLHEPDPDTAHVVALLASVGGE